MAPWRLEKAFLAVAADIGVGREFSFNIDYFKEDMTSGFRYASSSRLICGTTRGTIDKNTPARLPERPVDSDTGIFIQHERQPHHQGEGIEFTLSARESARSGPRSPSANFGSEAEVLNSQPT